MVFSFPTELALCKPVTSIKKPITGESMDPITGIA